MHQIRGHWYRFAYKTWICTEFTWWPMACYWPISRRESLGPSSSWIFGTEIPRHIGSSCWHARLFECNTERKSSPYSRLRFPFWQWRWWCPPWRRLWLAPPRTRRFERKTQSLSNKIDESSTQVMSAKRLEELKKLLIEFEDPIKTKLEKGGPADIPPLRVSLKSNSIPIRPKRIFILRLTRNYRLLISYSSFDLRKFFRCWMDFCAAHSSEDPPFSFMTSNGVVIPARTTKCGTNLAASF